MALTAEKIEQAKKEAIEFLEYSIYVTAILVGAALDEVSSTMTIPVAETHKDYMSYVSLKEQATVLEGLLQP